MPDDSDRQDDFVLKHLSYQAMMCHSHPACDRVASREWSWTRKSVWGVRASGCWQKGSLLFHFPKMSSGEQLSLTADTHTQGLLTSDHGTGRRTTFSPALPLSFFLFPLIQSDPPLMSVMLASRSHI